MLPGQENNYRHIYKHRELIVQIKAQAFLVKAGIFFPVE